MLIIIVTVATQGAAVDSEHRGNLKGLLFVNSGFFQAVGVISFGMRGDLFIWHLADVVSVCLPS